MMEFGPLFDRAFYRRLGSARAGCVKKTKSVADHFRGRATVSTWLATILVPGSSGMFRVFSLLNDDAAPREPSLDQI